MEHLLNSQPETKQDQTINTIFNPQPRTSAPKAQPSEKGFAKFYTNFMNMPEWKQMAITGGVILFLVIAGGGAYAAFGANKQPLVEEPKKVANVETVTTPTPTITEEESTPSPTASTKPSASPTATPKPSSTPTPKPSTTPTPNSNKTYVLNWSTGEVNTKIHQANEGYAVYALLKYDGATVTDQKNVKYTWTVADSSIADITPFTACIDGIKDPCPEDHATIKAKKEGSTTITAKATWKDTGAFIDDVTIKLNVSGGSSSTPTPSPTASSTPTPTPTPSPTPSPTP